MNLYEITFPLYKLRGYLEINTNPLGLVKVTTVKGEYILDDKSIKAPFEDRRLKLLEKYTRDKIYVLKEKVLYLRQLVKYKTGSKFIDYNGNIIKYQKSSKLYNIVSKKIIRVTPHGMWSVIELEGVEIPFLIGTRLSYNSKYASIMETQWGPFLYDITSIKHDKYKRKV